MTTIRLNINEKVLDKVLTLLGHFKNEDVEIIKEDSDYQAIKTKIEGIIQRVDSGQEKLVSQDELNDQLNKVLSKYDS
jgi:uncharacterized protein YaaN involved in tellurite resistance